MAWIGCIFREKRYNTVLNYSRNMLLSHPQSLCVTCSQRPPEVSISNSSVLTGDTEKFKKSDIRLKIVYPDYISVVCRSCILGMTYILLSLNDACVCVTGWTDVAVPACRRQAGGRCGPRPSSNFYAGARVALISIRAHPQHNHRDSGMRVCVCLRKRTLLCALVLKLVRVARGPTCNVTNSEITWFKWVVHRTFRCPHGRCKTEPGRTERHSMQMRHTTVLYGNMWASGIDAIRPVSRITVARKTIAYRPCERCAYLFHSGLLNSLR